MHNLRMELNGFKKDTVIEVINGIRKTYMLNFFSPDGQSDNNKILVYTKPQFPGGYDQMMKYPGTNVIYPKAAQESGIEGTVYVLFIVTETGRFSNLKILRGIFGPCDEEVIRVIKSMPKWIPGLVRNKMAVPVMIQLPIAFQLHKK